MLFAELKGTVKPEKRAFETGINLDKIKGSGPL